MRKRHLPPVLRGLLPVLLAALLCSCGAAPSSAPAAEPESAPASSAAASVAPSKVEAPPVQLRRNIDFDALREENPDIIAWIEVPGTDIDYPVMRTDDNAYYLSHNARREYDIYGAVFADVENSIDFTSQLMVVYGHFTPVETGFTQLHRYEDRSFFDANRDVYVYLPGRQLNYEVVSAFTTDDRWLTNGTDYADPDVMQGFIGWLGTSAAAGDSGEAAYADLDGVAAGDRLMVLSTCTQWELADGRRYLVTTRLAETLLASDGVFPAAEVPEI